MPRLVTELTAYSGARRPKSPSGGRPRPLQPKMKKKPERDIEAKEKEEDHDDEKDEKDDKEEVEEKVIKRRRKRSNPTVPQQPRRQRRKKSENAPPIRRRRKKESGLDPPSAASPTGASSSTTTSFSASETTHHPPSLIQYEWLGPHRAPAQAGGPILHAGVRIANFLVRPGQVVALSKPPSATHDAPGEEGSLLSKRYWLCRVEQIFEEGRDQVPRLVGQWLLTRTELERQLRPLRDSSARVLDLLHQLQQRQVPPEEWILTPWSEANDLASVVRPVQVRPAGPLATSWEMVCRFQLLQQGDEAWRLESWSGPENPPPDEEQEEDRHDPEEDEDPAEWRRPTAGSMDSFSSRREEGDELGDEDDEDDWAEAEVNQEPQVVIQEGEGSSLRTNIRVGTKHQARVGPFVPGRVVASRGAQLVWKPGSISADQLQDFLDRLATLHTAYLHRHGLTMTEPYTPLPSKQAEALMLQWNHAKLLTGSFLSTASILSTKKNGLLKECNVDAVLELLHKHEYDCESALKAAESNLNGLTAGWTIHEKALYDDGFRRYQGALRQIGQSIAPTKNMKDVVDYHYRFKIPDQFRRYQDLKRDQAMRIIQCSENRGGRVYEPSASLQQQNQLYVPGGSDVAKAVEEHSPDENAVSAPNVSWTEASVARVTGALQERRQAAKGLLLDVKTIMGLDTLNEVVAILRSEMNTAAREALLRLFDQQPELQRRFLEYLPKPL